jgi:hypothetical protein
LAEHFGSSLSKAVGDDDAKLEGGYRFMRNARVDARQIAVAGFRATAAAASEARTVLAIEDTTTLSYSHAARHDLGDLGGPAATHDRGFLVHSVLLVDEESGMTLGLVGQRFWRRDAALRGLRHLRKERPYEEKESFKWQRASDDVREVVGDEKMARVIAVGDREADVYEYLATKLRRGERFVMRASRDRRAADEERLGHLWTLMKKARVVATLRVSVPQRGDRPARVATVAVSAKRLQLCRPQGKGAQWPQSLAVGVVWAREENPPAGVEPLEWMLFTSEPVGTRPGALRVVRAYGRRWRIEDFHKLWKSGAGVERCRMKSAANIERMATILAFVAVRALQLRDLFESAPDAPCDSVLSETEWKVLYATVEKKRPPKRVPPASWAYRAIGRLAGWNDSKRTGRVGPKTLMAGWLELEAHVAGYEAFKLLSDEKTAK